MRVGLYQVEGLGLGFRTILEVLINRGPLGIHFLEGRS